MNFTFDEIFQRLYAIRSLYGIWIDICSFFGRIFVFTKRSRFVGPACLPARKVGRTALRFRMQIVRRTTTKSPFRDGRMGGRMDGWVDVN